MFNKLYLFLSDKICLLRSDDAGLLSTMRECRTLVCSQLHQMFIADPQLVHLVHYQGYPAPLLPMTVSLIPSMHICLDFIPELLAQAHLEKQVSLRTTNTLVFYRVGTSLPPLCFSSIKGHFLNCDLLQVFAIELASYLCLQHAIPRSLSIARLCITVVNTLIGVLPSSR